jgi:hypothetical protein
MSGDDNMTAKPQVESASADIQASAASAIVLGFTADPNWIGQGLGTLLMKHALRRCDVEGITACLESSNPRNISFYERHGFSVIGAIQHGSSPTMTPMLRTASRAHSKSAESLWRLSSECDNRYPSPQPARPLCAPWRSYSKRQRPKQTFLLDN